MSSRFKFSLYRFRVPAITKLNQFLPLMSPGLWAFAFRLFLSHVLTCEAYSLPDPGGYAIGTSVESSDNNRLIRDIFNPLADH